MPTVLPITSPRSADRAELGCWVERLLDDARAEKDTEVAAEVESRAIDVYAPDDMTRQREFWANNRSDGGSNALAVLKTLEQRGARWPCSAVPDAAALDRLKCRFPNFSGPVDEIRRAAALARLTPSGALDLPPMLLSGPPGIGKSKFARELSLVLGVPMLSFAMTQATASFSLGGLNAQYSNGGPGDLVRSFAQRGVPDLVVVLDEIDKAPVDAIHDPLGPLHDLLERDTAALYVDDGLRMPLNLGSLRWICTCNDPCQVSAPILSRLALFEIDPPTVDDMHGILAATYSEILERDGLSAYFDKSLPDEVCGVLSRGVPRDLNRTLRAALGAAALDGRQSIRSSDLPPATRSGRQSIGFL